MRVSKRLISFWERWERAINLGSLVGGFIFDLLIAKRPDSFYDNVLLLSYLCICALIIMGLNVRARRMHTARPLVYIFILQFCFGGLASNLLVLYGKSGTLGANLLFLVLLAGFMLGNEFLRTKYDQLRFNIAVYYFLLLTYCIIAVPTFILHTIGTWVFLVSGLVSLGIIACFLFILHTVVFRRREKNKIYEVAVIILTIFLIFDGLYFINLIPPVPLSLKSIGIYHALTPMPAPDAEGNYYTAAYEEAPWYVFWRDTARTYTYHTNESAYCFSAVFAPGNLSTPIQHRWEKYDEEKGEWQTVSIATFSISGGREDGYRGWSVESDLSPGEWRCDVETARGVLIGRMTFAAVPGVPTLSTTQL